MITLPLVYAPPDRLSGATWAESERFYPGDRIRQIERASIRIFMERHREFLRGRVLDFGAGTMPYRDLVEGSYWDRDKNDHLPEGPFDAIMCNQVLQYIEDPESCLDELRCRLRPGGRLVMTFPTNWAEVEETDLFRFTLSGMRTLLNRVGFHSLHFELRAEVVAGGMRFPLGYGVVAKK